jgi:hypothetical protein
VRSSPSDAAPDPEFCEAPVRRRDTAADGWQSPL